MAQSYADRYFARVEAEKATVARVTAELAAEIARLDMGWRPPMTPEETVRFVVASIKRGGS